jgi:SAM-dependent methyltransferase
VAATVSFDRQAVDFDRRAGLPAGVAGRIAAAVAELAPGGGGALLDLGAGTGQIGEHLVRACGARGAFRYLGLDLSGPMLAVFRGRLAAVAGGARGTLVRADAAATWPIASGRVRLVFVSRAAHLLPTPVLVEETLRVASPAGAVVVFGNVRSDPESLRAVVRREMRRLLAEEGVEGRRAEEARRRLTGALAERGGEVLPVATAASWDVVHRAADALAAWRAKSGLGGRAIAPEVQDRVLARLEGWIRERYGGLEVARPATERYELAAVRLPESTDGKGGAER